MDDVPYGVKVLAIFLAISGVISIIGGFLIQTPILGIMVTYLDNISKTYFYNLIDFAAIYKIILPFLIIISIIFFIGGVFLFILIFGLFKLQNWAYQTALIISIPSVIIIIGIFIIWFLLQDDVKDAFKRKNKS
ncbi:MAG: hypothetical protein EAX96_11050 [Candidatus Lokiarchaeota archaeon]|nr:hypothetical protein [Candidatus Lokiarchaeota archaeon]